MDEDQGTQRETGALSRRDFMKATGVAAVAIGVGPTLLSSCTAGGGGKKSFKILLWSHFVPKYDTWFDGWVKDWAKKNNATVTVDHINQADLPAKTAGEFAANSGHDLIEWITPPSAYEPSVLNVKDVVQEAENKYGAQVPFCKMSSFNPHTGKYYGFCHTWTPDPGDYRKSLWSQVGLPNGPSSYEELLSGGAEIKSRLKVRMGIGMSPEVDSNMAARAMIWSYGGSVQDANENVTLNSDATVAAVEQMVNLYQQSMSSEVFSWNAASNNQGLVAGQLSYILNSISAYRSAQRANPRVADDVFFVPALKGPSGPGVASEHVIRSYIVPKWAKNVDKIKQFLLDLLGADKDAVNNSKLYDFPAFANTPGVAPLPGWLASDPFGSQPANKLALLANAAQWSTNVGHPGPANAAIGEVFDTNVLPTMMADAARGKTSAKNAVATAHNQCEQIFAKWRKQGLVGGSG
jgi:hypothetical protein